jgi:hypothetical protein
LSQWPTIEHESGERGIHQFTPRSGVGQFAGDGCGTRTPANEPVQDLHLSTVDHRKVGFHSWLNIRSAAQIWIGADSQSGQLMSACALLARTPKPSDAQIDEAMSGNLCRCGTYPRIRAAIHQAAGAEAPKAA